MNFDPLTMISVIVAICALISPIITTFINLFFGYKMKKMEMKIKYQENNTLEIINILETYIRNIGRVISYDHKNLDLVNYEESYTIALLYIPENLIKDAQNINEIIKSNNYHLALDPAQEFIIKLRKEIMKLRKELKP